MARLVLLHSPLLGPSSWAATAEALRLLGHVAETPAWPRLGGVKTDYYAILAAGLAERIAPGEAPVLVAHSGAGALLPALASRLAVPPAAAIFVDAILPHPGRSWFDTVPAAFRDQLRAGAADGWLPPWYAWWPPGALEQLVPDEAARDALIAELEPIPAAFFEEAAPDAPLRAPAAYLRLSGAYGAEADAAQHQGWPTKRLPLNHLAILTQPTAVAAALQGVARA
ncbi:MAG: alpha/beta hydrolase [Phenylobacterium sp.]|nr:MAG: alpha/beta hydrolase [Phenylobacterium sp.]